MAVLTDEQRRQIWAKFMSDVSSREEVLPGSASIKLSLRAAVDAADARLEGFLSGLNIPPVAALSDLSDSQKLRLILALVQKRLEN